MSFCFLLYHRRPYILKFKVKQKGEALLLLKSNVATRSYEIVFILLLTLYAVFMNFSFFNLH